MCLMCCRPSPAHCICVGSDLERVPGHRWLQPADHRRVLAALPEHQAHTEDCCGVHLSANCNLLFAASNGILTWTAHPPPGSSRPRQCERPLYGAPSSVCFAPVCAAARKLCRDHIVWVDVEVNTLTITKGYRAPVCERRVTRTAQILDMILLLCRQVHSVLIGDSPAMGARGEQTAAGHEPMPESGPDTLRVVWLFSLLRHVRCFHQPHKPMSLPALQQAARWLWSVLQVSCHRVTSSNDDASWPCVRSLGSSSRQVVIATEACCACCTVGAHDAGRVGQPAAATVAESAGPVWRRSWGSGGAALPLRLHEA